MTLKSIIGHNKIKEILISSYKAKRFHHGLLFTGKEGIGKKTLAKEIAKLFNCTSSEKYKIWDACDNCKNCKAIEKGIHPDVKIVTGDENKQTIGVDTIRELREFVLLKPYMGEYKVIIIDNAHTLTVQAQNGFLKTLEEPPLDTLIILVTHKEYVLLPTIISRTQRIVFHSLEPDEVKTVLKRIYPEKEDSILEVVSYLCEGSPGRAKGFIESEPEEILKYSSRILGFLTKGELEQALIITEELNNLDWDRTKLKLLIDTILILLFEFYIKENKDLIKLLERYFEIGLEDILKGEAPKEKLLEIIKSLNQASVMLEFTATNWRLMLEDLLLKSKTLFKGDRQ